MTALEGTNLRDQELGDALGQLALLAGQDHLQHVSVELLHDNEHSLRCLEHAVQVDHARVVQALRGGRGGVIIIIII